MLLAANAGNSTVKVAPVDPGGRLGTVVRLRTQDARDADDLAAALTRAGVHLPDANRLALVSVVPAVRDAFAALARARSLPLSVITAAGIPIPTRVAAPDAVGADRLLNAYAAARLHGAPAIVVDFGTATTVSAVAADGAFVGGAIAPGLVLGLEALAARTAGLPLVTPAWPEAAAGRDTAEALRSGSVIGHLGAVRELVAHIGAELAADGRGGAAPRLVLAGGLAAAPWWADLRPDVVDPDLTLRGVALLAAEQCAGATS